MDVAAVVEALIGAHAGQAELPADVWKDVVRAEMGDAWAEMAGTPGRKWVFDVIDDTVWHVQQLEIVAEVTDPERQLSSDEATTLRIPAPIGSLVSLPEREADLGTVERLAERAVARWRRSEDLAGFGEWIVDRFSVLRCVGDEVVRDEALSRRLLVAFVASLQPSPATSGQLSATSGQLSANSGQPGAFP